ncbi:membrane protein [Aureimonas glaciei]|jgi:lipopolysaccharide export system protein LptC|uniref:Membrane protein n=2 Tax=Aureimonas glaciei TaxID=1776957 RepID=A0A916XS66_9HYPH|nr:membrane protein [Aureimonas glaciei]
MDRAVRAGALASLTDNRRSDKEFARARRHSRLVALLKIGLPAMAALIVVGGIAVTWLARALPDNVSVSAAGLQDGRIVMEDPRMSGYDKNQRPYSMVAQRAIQALDGSGIELEDVKANITISDSATADVLAARGHYEQKSQQLRLYDDVRVDTSSGMSIRLSDARIDMANGSMIGAGPVTINTPNQTIEAGSLDVKEGGKVLGFGGPVKMTLLPSPGDMPATSPTGKQPSP